MEAKEFIKNYVRMCKRHEDCDDCPLFEKGCYSTKYLTLLPDKLNERMVDIVEKWAKENPIEINQSKLLELFPNSTLITNGTFGICPKTVDKDCECLQEFIGCTGIKQCDCLGCKNQFWNSEYKAK